jgi:hypothetical protein
VSAWEAEAEASAAGRRRRRVYGLTRPGQLLAERARERLVETQRVLSDGALGSVGRSE